MSPSVPRCAHLPVLRLTQVAEEPGATTWPVTLVGPQGRLSYHRKPISSRTGRGATFHKFPVVLCGNGAPWPEACLYLVDRAKLRPEAIATLSSVAGDLARYREFLEELGYEWDAFDSADPFSLPTYQYRAHLFDQIRAGRIKQSVASRRMASVIGFYRHLQKRDRYLFKPAFSPWQEKDTAIPYRDSQGFEQTLAVKTTDIAIPVPNSHYAWDAEIEDGAKLRPLPQEEQEALISVLKDLGNTEMTLMHEFALLTGARAQTVLTVRLKHVAKPPSDIKGDYKLKCGPGTGIDTKRQRSAYLTIPKPFYARLHTYAVSERARKRRARSPLGESEENYLFLTQHGKEYYEATDDRNSQRESTEKLKSAKIGQGLRKFIDTRVVPAVRQKLKNPHFDYRFHDLRATFGMNFVDFFEAQMRMSPEKRKWVMHQLRELMWHKSISTTEKYLDYRHNLHMLKSAEEGWGLHLLKLVCEKEAP